MNLKQLEAFVKVAETKSFSAAAKQLYLTQPTISAHISSLEKELNACLLVRSTKGVSYQRRERNFMPTRSRCLNWSRRSGKDLG